MLGNEQFGLYIPLLAGKRVALYSNHTGIVGDKIFNADGSQADITNGNSDINKSLIPFGKDSEGNELIYGEVLRPIPLENILSAGSFLEKAREKPQML